MKNLFNAKITIQESTTTKDDSGSWTTTWANVSSLTDIPSELIGFSGHREANLL